MLIENKPDVTQISLNNNIYFGKGCLDNLSKELRRRGFQRALLVTGSESSRDNGSFKAVKEQIKDSGISCQEHRGVRPHTVAAHVNEGIGLGYTEKVDVIIAVGGGSTIDEAKIIGLCLANKITHIKDFISGVESKTLVMKDKSIPIIAIPTTASTGSEVNDWMSILCQKSVRKMMYRHKSSKPILTFTDPTFTLTLNKKESAATSFMMFSRILEQLYAPNMFEWTFEYLLAQARVVLKNAVIVNNDIKNYEARENLSWCSISINNELNMVNTGKASNDVGRIGLALTAMYEKNVGEIAALITPKWMEKALVNKDFKERTILIGSKLFGVKTANETIEKIETFIDELKLPKKLSDFKKTKKFTKDDYQFVCDRVMNEREVLGTWNMTRKDINEILEACVK